MKAFALFRVTNRRLLLPLLIAGAACAMVSTVHAQASLSFSGGAGTPLRITLNQPIVFTITATAASGNAPAFIFQGVGTPFADTFPAITGNITFQINAGGQLTLNTANSGFPQNNVAATDLYLFGSTSLPGVTAGNVVTLRAGTEITTANFSGTVPTSGTYNSFISDGSGTRISTFATPLVPEPSTWAMMLGGTGLLALVFRRRFALA